jgi:isopentenyl-diphosphate delta-isomerase
MSDASEEVVLVDLEDRPIGVASKLDAHRNGDLHRAFSVLIHDGKGKVLLQKRHKAKYHSGGLWSNTCCGHPRPGEDTMGAAARRLREEMGVACPLTPLGTLQYRADVGAGLIEHELVHLHSGVYDGPVSPDEGEAELYAWKTLAEVEAEAATEPERFTAWFCLYVRKGWPLQIRGRD